MGKEQIGTPDAAVFFNGRIYTMDDDNPLVEAVVVGGGRVLFTGGSDPALEFAGPDALRYDLRGLTVLPGLVDAHAHFSGYAASKASLDLSGTSSFEQVADIVAEAAKAGPHGRWITGRGWDQNDWDDKRFPDKTDLDRICPDNPVLLTRVCGHAAVANSRALEAAGIDRDSRDPDGGRIERDQRGDPTGMLLDEAVTLAKEAVPGLSVDERKRLMKGAARSCLEAGLTGVHEMGISSETAAIYRDLFGNGEMPLRITAYYDGDAEDLDSVLAAGPLEDFSDGMFSLAGAKFYMDGSLGARSAALLEGYSDDPGNTGIIVTDPAELAARILACRRSGFRVATHAIGDRANRMILDIYESVLAQEPGGDLRPRVEHAQIISQADIARFAKIGAVPSMQFTHCTSDMPWAGERLGEARLLGAYAWRSLLDAGSRIPGGSDFPVESIDPLLGIYAAVTRQDPAGDPPGGWMPEQRLSAGEAVRAFTLDAAWAAGQEDDRGSIEVGKRADLTILGTDIIAADPAGIIGTAVIATIVAGEIVYRADRAPF